jgi:Replicative DNA helicase
VSENAFVHPDAVLSQTLLDAQCGVLGAMLIDPDTVGPTLSRVQASDFTVKQYRTIFQGIQALFRDGKPVDGITVRGIIGDSFTGILTQLIDRTPTSAAIDVYTDLLKRSAMLTHLRDLGAELAEAQTAEDAQALLDKAMRLQVGKPDVQSLTFAQGYEQFYDRHNGETAVEFLDWDLPQLNSVIKAECGNIIIIGAYTGDGKTAFALQCAARFGRRHNVGYYSFESKKERLYDRHVSRTAMISSSKITANALDESDYKELIELKNPLSDPKVTIIDAAGMTAMDIIASSQANHYDIVIVDYLQQVEQPSGPYMKDFERVTEVSRELQRFAVRTDTAVISLSQLSRPDKVKVKYKGDDGEWHIRSITPPPTIGDLRSSGQIEQDADVILLMWREDYEVKESPRIIQVAKNRNGETLDKVRCHFDGDLQTFSRIAPGSEPPVRMAAPQSPQMRISDITSPAEVAKAAEIFPEEDGKCK